MAKVALKEAKGITKDFAEYDTHRAKPKAQGGTYDPDNYEVVDPVAHMEEHGILRLREEDHNELKALIDDREQMLKLKNKINNQLLAFKRRTDYSREETEEHLGNAVDEVLPILVDAEKQIVKWIKEHQEEDSLIKSAMGVKGLGEMTVAYLSVYIDLEKATTASATWSYTGLHTASHQRYTKGEAGGGNKKLRTALWRTADSMMKTRGAYREVYDRTKERLAISEKITKSRNTQGMLVEVAWKDTKPCHRHGAALRAVMKHILADYWFVGRTIRGLPTRSLYAEEYLGHTGIISPTERGWVF